MTPRIHLPPALKAGPFSSERAEVAGIARGRLRGPDIRHPYPSVNSSTDSFSILERCRAFAERMPPHAFFCSVTAAVVMRVLVWRELATELSLRDLVAAGDHLIHWRLPATTTERLAHAVETYPGRRGKPAMRQALQLLDWRAESRRESHLRIVIVEARLPGLVSNLDIFTRDGTKYRADFAFPQQKVIVEYQSEYHAQTEQFRRDMTRIAKLQADGWYVMQVNADDLRNPRELADRIRQILSERAFAR